MGDFVGAFSGVHIAPPSNVLFETSAAKDGKDTYRAKFIRVLNLLKPLLRLLDSPPHLVLSQLAEAVTTPTTSTPLLLEAKTLRLLSFFLSPTLQPVRKWQIQYLSLRSAMDRFDANLLAAFDNADGKADESAMRDAAESSWQVWDGVGDWELGKVWAEKREIFYQTGDWNPLDNFTSVTFLFPAILACS
jgi:recyclin-1